MTTWLKVIGSDQTPITGHPFYGTYKVESVGFRKARKPGIRTGDHLFLYAAALGQDREPGILFVTMCGSGHEEKAD